MNQRQAVFSAVVMVLGREPNNGEKVLDIISNDQLKQVHKYTESLFLSGEVELKPDANGNPRDAEYIRKYVPGLVNNWLRKDKALNGGNTYQAKNPGSRTGSGDAELMALKSLRATLKPGDPNIAAVDAHIEARKEELAAAKAKPINIEALPEKFRSLAEKIAPTVRKAATTEE